ncbi:MAG: hypothetical protein WCT10_05220 [Patescibacteria group bacterium]|jgi:predicted MarR family transcription regulator
MRSLSLEENEVLSFIRANSCVSVRDVCDVSYADEAVVDRILKKLIDLRLIRETDAGLAPADSAAADE